MLINLDLFYLIFSPEILDKSVLKPSFLPRVDLHWCILNCGFSPCTMLGEYYPSSCVGSGLEVRCNFNLANSTVLSRLELGTHLPNAASASQLTGAPNITMRIADRRGGDISSAKVSSVDILYY